MNSKVKWSLRSKILIMIFVILILGLGSFLITMTNLVQKDKTAYLFDNGMQTSKNIGQSFNSYLSQTYKDLAFILGDLNAEQRSFGASALARWRWQKEMIKASIYQRTADGSMSWINELKKRSASRVELWSPEDRAQVFSELKEASIQFFPLDDHGFVRAVYRFQGAAAFFAVVTLDLRSLYTAVSNDRGDLSVVMNHRNELIFANFNPETFAPSLLRNLALKDRSFKGSKMVLDDAGEQYLASFSSIQNDSLVIAQVTPRMAAFLPVYIAIEKIIYLFLGLLSSLLGFGLLASDRITSPLMKIREAAERVALGNFEIDLKVESKDEVGLLANGFNHMSSEVKRLMDENVLKGRMESELETAKTVQETLFPSSSFYHKNLVLEGFNQPASECGGDWWYYHEYEDSVLVVLGDATGHGAPAALLTASARSAFSVIQRQGVKSPKDVVKILNETLHDTAHGKINMTAFVGLFDKATPKLTYSLASHNPPYVLPENLTPDMKIRQVKTLSGNNHPRLGERLDVTYSESEAEILPGQHLVVFTDGLTELQSPEGKDWGDRKFIKSVIKAITGTSSLNAAMKQVESDVEDYRKDRDLDDDWTLLFVNRKP